ncbi:MAG: hypothetical protein H8D35_02145 [Nitrosopumilus sp.]|nr:hypothetical protein [Nitrosopumilus sp.]
MVNLDNVFNSIEDSKQISRINMDKAKTKVEKEYWIGVIGGLQICKQHLEQEILR